MVNKGKGDFFGCFDCLGKRYVFFINLKILILIGCLLSAAKKNHDGNVIFDQNYGEYSGHNITKRVRIGISHLGILRVFF